MTIAIVKYNAGNVRSVSNALRRLGAEPLVTDDAAELRSADKVIFPGVGEASSAMRCLRERGLDEVIKSLTRPVLGICLGMQLLCVASDENNTECLGLVPHRVTRFSSGSLKVPQIGWNKIGGLRSPLYDSVADGSYVYFVHSFFVELGPATAATCTYGDEFSAAVTSGNFYGVQFHPERSGRVGAAILRNFLAL